VATRKSDRRTFVESQWKPLLAEFEKSRLRRGKNMAKTGDVLRLQVKDAVVHAIVKNAAARGTVEVTLTTVVSFAPHLQHVASWFARRLDWLAAWMSGEWPDDFVDFLNSTGLRLFPNVEDMENKRFLPSCTCSDWEPLCAHVVAVIYAMIADVEQHPVQALQYVGVAPSAFLDAVHRQVVDAVTEDAAALVGAPNTGATGTALASQEANAATGFEQWPEEMRVFAPDAEHVEKRYQPRVTPVVDFSRYHETDDGPLDGLQGRMGGTV